MMGHLKFDGWQVRAGSRRALLPFGVCAVVVSACSTPTRTFLQGDAGGGDSAQSAGAAGESSEGGRAGNVGSQHSGGNAANDGTGGDEAPGGEGGSQDGAAGSLTGSGGTSSGGTSNAGASSGGLGAGGAGSGGMSQGGASGAGAANGGMSGGGGKASGGTGGAGCSGATPRDCSGTCIASTACCVSTECSGGKTCDATSHQCACPLGGAVSSCGTCLSWDFSTGVQGWQMLDPTSTTEYLTAENGRLVLHTTAPNYTGRFGADFMVPLCGTAYQQASVNGYTLTAKIQILNQMESVAPPDVILIYGNNGKFVNVQEVQDPAGYQWFTLTGTLEVDSSMVGIDLDFGSIFTGTILIEEVTLTPP